MNTLRAWSHLACAPRFNANRKRPTKDIQNGNPYRYHWTERLERSIEPFVKRFFGCFIRHLIECERRFWLKLFRFVVPDDSRPTEINRRAVARGFIELREFKQARRRKCASRLRQHSERRRQRHQVKGRQND